MAKPKKTFTDKEIEQLKALARCHCPDREIAAFLGCSERTVRRAFSKVLAECREAGKANIRAKQYELAMKGDKALLIWVGKQICGQKDYVETDTNFQAHFSIIHKLDGSKVFLGTKLLPKGTDK